MPHMTNPSRPLDVANELAYRSGDAKLDFVDSSRENTRYREIALLASVLRRSSPPHATPALSFREGTQSQCGCYEADELRHAPSRLRSFAPPRSQRIQMAPTALPNAGRQNPPRKAELQGWRPSFHTRTPAIRTERSPAHRACSI